MDSEADSTRPWFMRNSRPWTLLQSQELFPGVIRRLRRQDEVPRVTSVVYRCPLVERSQKFCDLTLHGDAELRFEYGDRRRLAASYHVEHLESRGALILVHLRAPAVTRKARDRKKASIAAETSCCG